MKKGRLTKTEHTRRLKLLLGFIFNFRYATRNQLNTFIQLSLNISSGQWLIEHTLEQGFINDYREPLSCSKIYYLTQKGKDLIAQGEIFIDHYRFEKRYTGTNTLFHHNIVVESYFLLNQHLKIKEWACEWVIRIGKKKRERIPDGLMILPDGKKIALEAETHYKKLSVWKSVVARYRYDIEKVVRYHFVLIVASARFYYESTKNRLFNISPEFCAKAFVLTDLGMLEQGMCLYQGKLRHIEEVFKSSI